jgi:hypothetical protein
VGLKSTGKQFICINSFKKRIMSKYLIEVSHGAGAIECLHSVAIFLSSGSHFLTNADWGCLDGEHKAWFVMEAENKREALQVVPPGFRKDTKILQLNKFRLEEVQSMISQHEA